MVADCDPVDDAEDEAELVAVDDAVADMLVVADVTSHPLGRPAACSFTAGLSVLT